MSQNINIIYKVDSSQVTQSTQAVNQAKAATDQLTQSANKLGQQGSKNNIQFGNTIEGVKLKMQQLKGQIDLTNQTDKKRLDGLISQYKAAQKQLESYNAKLKDSNKEGVAGTNSLTSSFGGLYNAIKLVIGAQVVKQFVGMSIEAAALSGKVEGIERAFQHAFPNATQILYDLRKATHGTVVDFELMQRTLQATNLGVAVEQLPVLFEFAAARAKQTGESVDYLVDSIVRGIGRKSVLVLDNLGLSAVRLKEQFNGASLASQSVADVTAAVGRIAKEELEKMGGYVEDNATKVDQLKVSWTGLGIEIAKLATGKGGIISYFDDVVSKFKDLFESINKGISVQDLYRDRLVLEAAQEGINIIKQKEFNGEKEHDLELTKQIIAEKTHELIQQQEEIKNLEARQKALFKLSSTKNVGPEFRDNIKAINDTKKANEVLIEQIKILKGLQSSMIVKTELQEKDSDSLEFLENKVQELNKQLQATEPISTKAGISEARRIKDQINATEDKIEAIKKEIYWEEILQKRREGITPKSIDKIDEGKALNDIVGAQKKIEPKIPPIVLPTPIIPESGWDKLKDSFQSHYQDITNIAFNSTESLVQAQLDSEVAALDERINKTREFYDTQMNLAGDNDKAKQRLRIEEDKKIKDLEKQRNEREKKNALSSILINTALGIVKAIATAATIYDGLVQSAIVAAEGAVQYSVASKTRYYAKGEIDIKGGQPGKDSIPAMLMPRESVMTSDETISSGKTLRMIRAKKLNDKVLDRIMAKANSSNGMIGFDDSRLLEATKRVEKAASGNDIIRKGAHIYEAKKQGDKMKTYIRSKSLN